MQEIIEQKHDTDTCKYNWKENAKIFNLKPRTCDYFAGSSVYNDLLMYEKLESPDMVASNSDDEISSSIGKFLYMLAILEETKLKDFFEVKSNLIDL